VSLSSWCSTQGIGRATALLFAKKGYNVVVAARNKERLDQVVADCAEVAGRPTAAMAVRTDVTDEAAVQDLVNRTLAKFDSVDVVVNNAGEAEGHMEGWVWLLRVVIACTTGTRNLASNSSRHQWQASPSVAPGRLAPTVSSCAQTADLKTHKHTTATLQLR
jgi:NAD(P)-dependent dehydrogenase (short-subunit alcohol dehydrogenase family)